MAEDGIDIYVAYSERSVMWGNTIPVQDGVELFFRVPGSNPEIIRSVFISPTGEVETKDAPRPNREYVFRAN